MFASMLPVALLAGAIAGIHLPGLLYLRSLGVGNVHQPRIIGNVLGDKMLNKGVRHSELQAVLAVRHGGDALL